MHKETVMRVIDVAQVLMEVAKTHPNLQLVVACQDDRGNEIECKVSGAVTMKTDQYGPYVVMR